MGLVRKLVVGVVAAVVIVVGGIAVGYFTGVLGAPTGGVADVGDWGEVSEERTEIVTTIWVRNPNPIGLTLGEGVSATYEIRLNGVTFATGEKEGISVHPGNNTIELSTFVENDRLAPWWVAFIEDNETIDLRVGGEVTIETAASASFDFPARERTMLEDSTPVISALSSAADGFEGTYTRSATLPAGAEVTAGYEVRSAWATWGEVTDEHTTALFHFELHNPGDVPVPATPDGIGVSVDMNDVRMFRAEEDAMSTRNVEPDALIMPGETREVVIAVTMDNGEVDEWFTSHVGNGERSDVEVTLQLVFRIEETGTTIRVPEEGGITYRCEFQTGILVDGQETSTTCGEGGTAGVG